MPKSKSIDWNQMAKLGLIIRINKEILHPLGLAMNRNPETGVSECAYVSVDGVWEYHKDVLAEDPKYSDEEIKARVQAMISGHP